MTTRRAAAVYGSCPNCTAAKVKLVVQGDHLAWNLHYLRTWGQSTLQCRASGQRFCETGEGTMPLHPMGLTCKCGKEKKP